MYRYFKLLVKFIPEHFILCDVAANQTVFYIFFKIV